MSPVEIWYRVLGLVAPVNQRMSRFRVNFIPTNLAVMFVLGLTAAGCGRTFFAVLEARSAPERQPLSELLGTPRPPNYVAVEGRLATDARIDVGPKGSVGNLQTTDYAWAPLVDRSTRKAILVQFPADRTFDPNAEEVTVEGMLRPITRDVSRQLSQKNFMHAGLSIDRRFMLVEGRRPGSLGGPMWYGGIAAIMLLALVWTTMTRNVVFMPSDRAPVVGGVAAQASATEPLLVSGTLAMDAATRRFFTNMPAAMGRTQNGDTTLFSHIETSTTVWGMKTNERSGLWVLGIRSGSITEAQPGHVFWGTRKFQAIRFRYVSALTGTSEHAVVASALRDPAPLFQGR